MNEELSAISKKQGYNVDSIVKLVNENEEILDAMKENIRQKVLQGRNSVYISPCNTYVLTTSTSSLVYLFDLRFVRNNVQT